MGAPKEGNRRTQLNWGMPHNFIWLWILPTLGAIYWLSNWRRKSQMRSFGDEGLMERLVSAFNPLARVLKRWALFFSILFIILALCQPHYKTREVLVERKGIDVVIALDVSQSMLSKDMPPNRLEKAKLELSGLIDRLKQDRVGLVAFAGDAYIQCPLTLDKSAAKLFLSTINPNLIPLPGTDIGKAMDRALMTFTDKDKKYKAIILLTDGEDHSAHVKEATNRAKDAGVKIFAIGIGTQEGSIVPSDTMNEGFKKDREGRTVLSKLDENLLKEITQKTGGVYYRSTRGELEVDHLLQELKFLGQKGLKQDKSIEYEENYQYFLVLALMMLLIEITLSERKSAFAKKNLTLVFILILYSPLLCGFKFYSAIKNEEGNKLYRKGQIDKAKKAYEKALKSEPKQAEVAYNLGNTLFKEESYKESLDSYKKAASNDKSTWVQSKAFYNIGNALFRENNKEKAAEFYKQALRIDPKDQDAKYNLELLTKQDQKQDKQNKQDQKKQPNQASEDKKSQGSGGGKDQEQKNDKQNEKQNDKQNEKESSQASSQKDEGQGQNQKDQEKKQSENGQEQNEKKEENSEEKLKSSAEKQDLANQDQKKDGQEKQSAGEEQNKNKNDSQSGQGEEGKNDEKPKDEAQPSQKPLTLQEASDDQILNALEGQEKQVLKYGRLNERNHRRTPYNVEKDW